MPSLQFQQIARETRPSMAGFSLTLHRRWPKLRRKAGSWVSVARGSARVSRKRSIRFASWLASPHSPRPTNTHVDRRDSETSLRSTRLFTLELRRELHSESVSFHPEPASSEVQAAAQEVQQVRGCGGSCGNCAGLSAACRGCSSSTTTAASTAAATSAATGGSRTTGNDDVLLSIEHDRDRRAHLIHA